MEIKLNDIAENYINHARHTEWWVKNDESFRAAIAEASVGAENLLVTMSGFEVTLPLVSFGAVESLDLLGLDELIIFSFYSKNTKRYERVADLGANIGVHTQVLAKMGFQVEAFEPDPEHTQIYKSLRANDGDLKKVIWKEKAVVANSQETPKVEFVRVRGNTTSSHVRGAKPSPYGDLEFFFVETESIKEIIKRSDLVKMDVEGLEFNLLSQLEFEDLLQTDIILEVGTEVNARLILEWGMRNRVSMFSQKTGWSLVTRYQDLPVNYKEGSLFLTASKEMPWS
jgi:FkbM family methyltransferase